MNNVVVFKKLIGVNVCCFFNRGVSIKNFAFDRCPLRENLFGQSTLLMIAMYIVFPKVFYKFVEWSLHLELTFMTFFLNWMS